MAQVNKTIVITQPYFFPWIGLFEQIRLTDIFVFYDDVQFSKGHFQDRVQIKTKDGFKWMTVPKKGLRLGQLICEIEIDYKTNWKKSHLDFLKQVYKTAPFLGDMISIVKSVYDNNQKYLSQITIESINAVSEYYDLIGSREFFISSDLLINGHSTQRVLDVVKYFEATRYISALGALKYFDFELFEREDKRVEFIDYKKIPYPQLYGTFNPYVSVLDLVANTGTEGISFISSTSVYWKDFIKSASAREYLSSHK